MHQWRDFPLPNGSYSDDTRPWSQQDVCNYLPTFAEGPGTRSRMKYACVPGLQTFATVGNGPHRGGHDVEGMAFVVSGQTLYRVAADGTATSKGTIPGTGFVSMTHNQIDGGNQLVIATRNNSYVYNTVSDTLAATGVGLSSVDFLNQRILGVDTQRRFWRYSGLADATSYNDLDNESAESSPDRIVGGVVSQGEWLVFGERTLEVWTNTPTENTAFQRSVVVEKGCGNANTIKRLDNSVFWLGNDGIAYRMQGYQPVPISPKALTTTFRACDPSKAFAFTYEDNGYVIYYLSFQDGQTWGYDVTNQKWHRRESFGLDRWRLNTLFKSNGDWYGGDYSSGKLYKLRWGYVYEGCEIMPRGIRSGVVHGDGNRVFLHGFRLNMESGGVASAADEGEVAPIISGSLPDTSLGDVVNYQYTITRAYPGQAVTLTLGGALPTGLTLNAEGLVTGTVTDAGTFNWTITPSGECVTGTAFADSAQVGDTIVSAIQADSPILYYKLNETSGSTAIDYSGNGYNGTLSGSYTHSSTGLTLNAKTSGIKIGTSPINVGLGTAWTIEAIITRTTGSVSSNEIIIASWNNPNLGYANCALSLTGNSTTPGKPRGFYTESPSLAAKGAVSATAVTNGVRTHLMIVREPGNMRLYVNGVEDTVGVISPSTSVAVSAISSLTVGGALYPDSYGFIGKLEHIAIYDASLSAARALYHAQKAGLA